MLQRIIYWFTYLSLPYLYIRRFDPEGFSHLMLYMRTSMSFRHQQNLGGWACKGRDWTHGRSSQEAG